MRIKWNRLTYFQKLACVSLYSEEALKDKDWRIRCAVYRGLGYTSEALDDENEYIRQEARLFFNVSKVKGEVW